MKKILIGFTIIFKFSMGYTLDELEMAIENKDINTAKKIMKTFTKSFNKDINGRIARDVLNTGNIEIIKYFESVGIDFKESVREVSTTSCEEYIVESILNTKNSGNEVFLYLAEKGYVFDETILFKYLLEIGNLELIKKLNEENKIPLEVKKWMVKEYFDLTKNSDADIEVMKYLISSGVKVNDLTYGVIFSDIDKLKSGIDEKEETQFEFINKVEILKYLVDNKVLKKEQLKDILNKTDSLEIAEYLINSGFSISEAHQIYFRDDFIRKYIDNPNYDVKGESPLVWTKNVDSANLLIQKGADVNKIIEVNRHEDEYRWVEVYSPIKTAFEINNIELIKLYLSKGAKISNDIFGDIRSKEALEIIIDNGISFQSIYQKGGMPNTTLLKYLDKDLIRKISERENLIDFITVSDILQSENIYLLNELVSQGLEISQDRYWSNSMETAKYLLNKNIDFSGIDDSKKYSYLQNDEFIESIVNSNNKSLWQDEKFLSKINLQQLKKLIRNGFRTNEMINGKNLLMISEDPQVIQYLVLDGMYINYKLKSEDEYSFSPGYNVLMLKLKADSINENEPDSNNLEKEYFKVLTSYTDNDIAIINYLLNRSVDLSYVNSYGKTALMYSCGLDLATAKRLIKSRGDINIVDNTGKSVLYYAILNGSVDHVKYYLENGAKADIGTMSKKNLFDLAIEKDNLEILKILVEKLGKINTNDISSGKFLANAVKNNNLEMFKYLLSQGVSAKSKYIENMYDEMAQKTTKIEMEVICDAVKLGNIEMVSLLLNNGANPNAIDTYGYSILDIAISAQNTDIAELLLKKGANANFKNKDGKTPLMFAKNLATTKLLVENGSIINAIDNEGKTALFYISDVDSLKYLINNKADLSIKDKNGENIFYNDKLDNIEVSKEIVATGFDIKKLTLSINDYGMKNINFLEIVLFQIRKQEDIDFIKEIIDKNEYFLKTLPATIKYYKNIEWDLSRKITEREILTSVENLLQSYLKNIKK